MKPQKREVLMAVTDLLADCRGQAYDRTGSMSSDPGSDKRRVQGHIQKIAPDAEYQGCCLAFFDNSPKRKKFLDKVIDSLSAKTKKA